MLRGETRGRSFPLAPSPTWRQLPSTGLEIPTTEERSPLESPDTLKNPMVVEKHRMSGTGGGIPFRRAFPGDPVHVLNKEQCEAIMEFNDLKNKGSTAHFYKHESQGLIDQAIQDSDGGEDLIRIVLLNT